MDTGTLVKAACLVCVVKEGVIDTLVMATLAVDLLDWGEITP